MIGQIEQNPTPTYKTNLLINGLPFAEGPNMTLRNMWIQFMNDTADDPTLSVRLRLLMSCDRIKRHCVGVTGFEIMLRYLIGALGKPIPLLLSLKAAGHKLMVQEPLTRKHSSENLMVGRLRGVGEGV